MRNFSDFIILLCVLFQLSFIYLRLLTFFDISKICILFPRVVLIKHFLFLFYRIAYDKKNDFCSIFTFVFRDNLSTKFLPTLRINRTRKSSSQTQQEERLSVCVGRSSEQHTVFLSFGNFVNQKKSKLN